MINLKNLKLNDEAYEYNPKKVNEAGGLKLTKNELDELVGDVLINADKGDLLEIITDYLTKTQKEELMQNIVDNKWYNVYESLEYNSIIEEI